MVKYDANQEITNTHENLQIVRSQFFTHKLIFIYMWSIINQFVYQYSDLMSINTNKEPFSYI
jgi:hypothetical protein